MGNRQKNGLKRARERAGLTQEGAAEVLGYSKDGYAKIEQGSRGLKDDFIVKAAAAFGVKPQDIISISEAIDSTLGEIDEEALASLVTTSRERLAGLSPIEAKNLVLSLISAARKPPSQPKP
jgi:transcriptional regulator with XRE-family HTH domain